MQRFLLGVLVGILVIPDAAAQDTEADNKAEALFATQVLPTLREKCFACHGEDKQDVRGEYNMLSRGALLEGGESGEPAVVPGDPEKSPLVAAIRWESLEMPPKENDRLSETQIQHVVDWIAAGAPWPAAERLEQLMREARRQADGIVVSTSGGLSADWTNRKYEAQHLWAYQPLQPVLAELSRTDKSDHPIDQLIESRLQALDLSPAPLADRRTLIRRATYDLTGLPPTPAEVEAFLWDPAGDEDAFARLVDRLLQSPHYGEQWGRHWLDVVRYADSSGYANDYERGNSWRYRDYVVRAFNEDKPYDQFIREQIAGDEIDPTNPEMLIAVGFLRMGPWELTAMEVAKVARQRFLDDVTDAVGQVFLAHMLQCARCHDHKFDPIPTRDYYSLQAVFATTQLSEREAAFLPAENLDGFDEKRYLDQRADHYRQVLGEVEAKRTVEAARKWYAENELDSTAFEQVVSELQKEKPDAQVDIQRVRSLLAERKVDPAQIPPRHVGFEPRDFGMERIARKGLQRLTWRLERYQPVALSVYSGRTPQRYTAASPQRMPMDRMTKGELEQTAILIGGDPFSQKDPVSPATLSVVSHSRPESPHKIPDAIEGRRTALADWISSPANPLTARVIVNRVWQWHFGRALAGNPNNFGTTGKKPTHPRLLDLLAIRLMQADWSIKDLHRFVLQSRAYRRSSRHPAPADLHERDPQNSSYAVFLPRRLEAEELRDAMLSVSGSLNRVVGGIPIRPEMNMEAALQPRMVMGTFAEAWQPSQLPSQRHRRSIYALRIRGLRDPFLEVFNSPSSDLSCEARDTSTVTPQVFAMFNSEISFDRALAFANRLLQEAHTDGDEGTVDRAGVIRHAYQLAYNRAPRSHEVELCLQHWKQMESRHEKIEFSSPQYPRQVRREAVEENTGEKFTFEEPLEVYADFVPDLKPADASPLLRGLAEVCLVLFNANEFAYVY